MPFGADAHRQDVVGEVRGLVPDGGERRVQPDQVRVGEHLDPAHTVRVGPHRVVDPGEVHVEAAAALLEEVRQQERHLIQGERVVQRPGQLVPGLRMAWRVDRAWHELVPCVGGGAPLGGDRAEQAVEQEQAARHLPAAQVPGGCGPPAVRGQPGTGVRHGLCDLGDHRRRDAGLSRGEIERVFRVQLLQDLLEPLERLLGPGMLRGEVFRPVPPAADEFPVVAPGPDEVAGDREQDRRLRPRVGRQPVVGVRGGVGQPGVDHDQRRTAGFGVHDALRMRVEVVARLQMRADQQDHVGVGVVGTRPVDAHPVVVARAGTRGAHVGVGVVPVHAPAGQDPLGEAVLARPADVIHDLVRALPDDGRPDPARDVVERVVPAHLAPSGPAPRSPARLSGCEDAVGVGDLVEGRGALGAVAAARARDARGCPRTCGPAGYPGRRRRAGRRRTRS